MTKKLGPRPKSELYKDLTEIAKNLTESYGPLTV